MPMKILTMLVVTFAVAIPALMYYLYWDKWAKSRKLSVREKRLMLEHTKMAYLFIGIVVLYIPAVLLYFLYSNFLYMYPMVWRLTIILFVFLVLGFEIMSLLNYVFYEKKRFS
ncbi:MAG: hypothetical protein ABH829_02250 [archaeon]